MIGPVKRYSPDNGGKLVRMDAFYSIEQGKMVVDESTMRSRDNHEIDVSNGIGFCFGLSKL